jgi:hypothetical protein
MSKQERDAECVHLLDGVKNPEDFVDAARRFAMNTKPGQVQMLGLWGVYDELMRMRKAMGMDR